MTLDGITEDQRLDAAKLGIRREMVEAAVRAHWPTWDNMRTDHQREHRAMMLAALMAAFSIPRRP
jgi:hypothetical protein